jgi:hypothetical protein
MVGMGSPRLVTLGAVLVLLFLTNTVTAVLASRRRVDVAAVNRLEARYLSEIAAEHSARLAAETNFWKTLVFHRGKDARIASLESDLAELRQDFATTRKNLKERKLMLALGEETREKLQAGPPVPLIDAKVAAVRADVTPQLVLLTVGSDDKVEKGFHFSIYRGSDFVAKVVVEKVLKDSCGCRTLYIRDGQSIQTGDCAATRLQ